MIELEITTIIPIDEEEIIEDYKLDKNSSNVDIRTAIFDYVESLDDYDYYLIGFEEREDIFRAIKNKLFSEDA